MCEEFEIYEMGLDLLMMLPGFLELRGWLPPARGSAFAQSSLGDGFKDLRSTIVISNEVQHGKE